MAATAEDTDEIGYSFNTGGLNNQLLALLGLFYRAYDGRKAVVLPMMTVKDHVLNQARRISFGEVFDTDDIKRLAKAYGLSVLVKDSLYFDTIQEGRQKNGWTCFDSGAARMSEMARGTITNPQTRDFIFDFFEHLTPLIRYSHAALALKDRVQEMVDVVAQFRIETDWKKHSDAMKAKQTKPEDIYLPPNEIVRKILNTLPATKVILVTSDEAAMPWTKQQIAADAQAEFGVRLLWKSDILTATELASFNNLELSLIDLELAMASRCFVGLTRSTFANMVTFRKFARSRDMVKTDYFYNTATAFLGQRHDNGGWDHPHLAEAPWEHPHYGWPRPAGA